MGHQNVRTAVWRGHGAVRAFPPPCLLGTLALHAPRWRSHRARRAGGRSRSRPDKERSDSMATSTGRAATEDTAAATEHLTREDRVELLRYMLLMRGIEDRAMTLYRQGKVPGSFYDGYGQEAVSVGAAFA